jgi:hypothetical protein
MWLDIKEQSDWTPLNPVSLFSATLCDSPGPLASGDVLEYEEGLDTGKAAGVFCCETWLSAEIPIVEYTSFRIISIVSSDSLKRKYLQIYTRLSLGHQTIR